jgi:hypothetical protein
MHGIALAAAAALLATDQRPSRYIEIGKPRLVSEPPSAEVAEFRAKRAAEYAAIKAERMQREADLERLRIEAAAPIINAAQAKRDRRAAKRLKQRHESIQST